MQFSTLIGPTKPNSLLSITAAALCLMGSAHATVLNFNNPGVIDIDNDTGVATYTEAGYTITGQAADFLTLDGVMVGGFEGAAPFSLKPVGGGNFTLNSLDYAFFDLGGPPSGTFNVTGLLGTQVVSSLSLVFNGADAASFTFGPAWATLSEVTFSGSAGFSIDNIGVVPEPASALLLGLGLTGLLLHRARRQRSH